MNCYMNNRLIYIIIVIISVSAFLFSCDPGYYVAINNKTAYEKTIQVNTHKDTLRFYQNVEDKDFNYGKMIKSIPNQSSVTIPPGQILIIDSYIGGPSSDVYIVTDKDTIPANEFPAKRLAVLGRKFVYIINE